MSFSKRHQVVGTVHTTDATPTGSFSIDVTALLAEPLQEACNGGVFVVEACAVGQTSGNVNCYRLAVHFAFLTGTETVHLVGSVGSGLTCEEDAAWDCTISLATPELVVTVTGDAAEHVEWTIWTAVSAFAHLDL